MLVKEKDIEEEELLSFAQQHIGYTAQIEKSTLNESTIIDKNNKVVQAYLFVYKK